MKRFHQCVSESSRPIKKLEHYACPDVKVFIETRGQKHAMNVFRDSGSNILLKNWDTEEWLDIRTEASDSPLKSHDLRRHNSAYQRNILYPSYSI